MTAQQPNLVNLARQGDGKAIAALINRSLQPKGILAKVVFQDGYLKIMLEGETTPDQAVFVSYVQQGIVALDIPNLHTLQVFGRVKGTTKPDWTEVVPLQVETAIAQSETSVEPVETAIDINEDAIVSHLNQAIGSETITFSAELTGAILNITAKTDQLLEGDTFAKSIRESLFGLSLTGIESVQLYKQKTRSNARYKIKEFTLVQETSSIAEPEKTESVEPRTSIVNSAPQMRSSVTLVDSRPRRQSNKIAQFVPLAIIIIVFVFVSITRLLSVPPSAADLCRASSIEKQRCLLAVQVAGEQTIIDAKKDAIANTQQAEYQGLEAAKTLAFADAQIELEEKHEGNSKLLSSIKVTSSKSEEVFRGVSLVDVQIGDPKTPETIVFRKAVVLQHSKRGLRLLSDATIPNNWPTQAYTGTSETEKVSRSLKVHQIFIVLGGSIVFTSVGLFIANLLNLGIRIFSVQTLFRTAVVLGTVEATLLLILGRNWIFGIPFGSVALLITQMIVKDLKVDWEAGYRVVAAGVGVIIITRVLLNWMLFGLIFSIL
ncbi:hypothetical protein [Leptolyngbya sp. NIES-2104]|uniref:hypothetical protein n=1 Tax=Leptolyngbya sp. NIES-2104 TaxID=1552121 RepID=UPI0006EC865B|nr:hypothetical protein [Leptolyngbya sp. NIES-2104]GAP94705.1 hypothetical protein NIES2104_12170 [Leptolyngbya sp. NIES-2104]